MKIQNDSVVLPIPDEKLIARVEDSFEIKFPADFIHFLSKNNGAIPITRFFKYKSNEYVVDRFLCLLDNPRENDRGMYDIKVVFSQLDERIISDEDSTGAELVPFAALFAGNFVCLDYRDNEKNPTICIWYNEDSGEFEPVTEKIANSVDEFVTMLEE
ncbi:SMI1/KNR4 family protein [Priestia endophytica]|uniref:SMI1/KNR4 family protein n=1 Tax=Priestia endophytica TaxID=135735 RepID=UPI000DCA8EA6|nr:SMI1/KNR4 family protein [Priestia endophytica]RAS79934.1 SMI1/KNR4 family protein [Priestia endophytica]